MSENSLNSEVFFYYRDGCHLCEEMAAVLRRQWPDLFARLQWRNVDSDPAWQASYGRLIPALVLGQELVCNYVVSPERITACFGGALNPV